MGIFTNLAKGFITSAVNQVGRDGGKVISNKVYGNSHSTPIRLTSSNETTNFNDLIVEDIDGNKNVIINRIESSWDSIKYIGVSILAVSTPYFGLPLSVFLGYKNSKKSLITIYNIERRAVYSQDRRFKNGQRHDGYREFRVPTKTLANTVELAYLKRKSKIYYIISLISIGFWLSLIAFNLIS